MTMGLSADGSVVVGSNYSPSSVWRWTAGGGFVSLGRLPGDDQLFGRSVSADGSVVCIDSFRAGFGNRATRWTAQAGLTYLGTLNVQSYTSAVSADGNVIVGGSDGTAYRWTGGGGMLAIDGFSAMAVNADGSVVVGTTLVAPTSTFSAFRWTAGVSELIGGAAGQFMRYGEGVSGDGHVVVGSSQPTQNAPDGHAVFWTRGSGVVDLNEFLPAHGVDLSGWALYDAVAINLDGRVITGNGVHNGRFEAWVAHVPRCGDADFNHDGSTGTDQDIEAFFACLAGTCCATCSSSDFNDDGDVGTDADIEAFFRVLAGAAC